MSEGVEMPTSSMVMCPYCFEQVELVVDPETEGTYVEDCEVCCRPWQITIVRAGGHLDVAVERAQ